jgi:antitoxin (DNA-binding transcriptional repressor) of toxin-antitoxin stability system
MIHSIGSRPSLADLDNVLSCFVENWTHGFDEGLLGRLRQTGVATLQQSILVPKLNILFCDVRMYHMKKASVRDLRYGFKKIERLLHQGEEVQITKRRRVIARLVPENEEVTVETPDFLARMRTIYGDKILTVSGADLVSSDRSRY